MVFLGFISLKILVQLNTAYFSEGKIIKKRSQIRDKYLRT
jgi:hypothetical protein